MSSSKLTEEHTAVLDLYMDSFREASRKERKRVLQNALKALFPKVRDASREDKAIRQQAVKDFKPVN
jgi:hypothetical protein